MPSLTLLENQGFCNTNYLLKTDTKKYIIRVFGSLHVNRKKEFQIAYEAYKKGIAARPIYQDNSFMIYEFLEGTHKYKLNKKDIKTIAILLKKLHQISTDKKLFNKKRDHVLCHHDLNPKNFVFSNNIKLIDWEYARLNDRYFDLATVIIEFNLNQKEEKLFLHSYFKSSYEIDKKKVYSFKAEYSSLCKNWFTNQKDKIKYIKKLYECNKR
ncbi:phosphotransferase family protein [Sulfurospirillum sp.]|nr:phosphotransferase family protein [Sulfurospirillum sp.]